MASFNLTAQFLKAATKLQKEYANKTFKALLLFHQDPAHRGLNYEKLQGCAMHSIRIDQAFRIILQPCADLTIFHYVGSHDDAYRIAKTIAPVLMARLGGGQPA